ncbi:hypothetical protein Q8A67_003280 [Cirrhinus molitorella]|uniref:Caspase-8 n=1 Tax=Cirrhinus molitorella TaxID=172907 RepID=A0AA88TXQ2_9TELE|nr:hypothetical protein Q8A67_003280 [Cirrhinus molitorella]
MAEKVLEQLRNELIQGLSEPIINSLLDDLQENKVLGNEEIEVIRQKMKTRSDQARDLIDGVRKKGSKASELMFTSLKNRDNCLYENLKIDSHLAIPETRATCSPAPMPHNTTDKQNNLNEEYKMDSNPRGLCVIINNENFVNRKRKRNGSQNDVDSLKALFKYLGFLVEVEKDKTANQIKELMTEYSKYDHHGDCFVCCVMSHGNETGVEGCDEHVCPLDDITSPFDGDNCHSLVGKPKVFIIQACRGTKTQSKLMTTDSASATHNQTSADASYSIPKDSDFLIALATVEGYFSVRNPVSGSWFIQSLCKHLKKGSEQGQDILRILTNVNNDVSRREGILIMNKKIVDAKMTPQPQFTLRKLLIFKAPKGQAAASKQKRKRGNIDSFDLQKKKKSCHSREDQ